MNPLDRSSTPTDCFWPTPVSLDADHPLPAPAGPLPADAERIAGSR